MTPEERSLLESTYKLAEENNKILRSLRRSARLGTIMRILYWVAIMGVSVGALYFIQPYLKFITDLGSGSGGNVSQTLQDLLK